jgi:nitrate/nitrite-specific signal transduction histidine kinase
LENKNIFELGTEVPELVEIRDLAVGMAPGEVDTLRYPWPDKDGNIGTKVAKFGYFEGYKWVVVAAAFEHEILAPFYTDLKFLVAFLSLTLVGVTFLAILIARVLIRPVLQLTKATAAIARNDYTVKLPVTTRDEIGQMAHSFGVMVNNLRDARNGLMEWSRTLEQKVAERTMALEKAQESMIMSEKMASLGKLSAMVAHEINNPLSGVLSYLKLTIKLLGRSDPRRPMPRKSTNISICRRGK